MSSSSKKAITCVLGSVATVALGFLVEPIFPLGSWRWGIIIGVCAVLFLVVWREEIHAWILEWVMTDRRAPIEDDEARSPEPAQAAPHEIERDTTEEVEPEPEPSPAERAFYLAKNNGKLTANFILEQESIDDADRILEIFRSQPNQLHAVYAEVAKAMVVTKFSEDEREEKWAWAKVTFEFDLEQVDAVHDALREDLQ